MTGHSHGECAGCSTVGTAGFDTVKEGRTSHSSWLCSERHADVMLHITALRCSRFITVKVTTSTYKMSLQMPPPAAHLRRLHICQAALGCRALGVPCRLQEWWGRWQLPPQPTGARARSQVDAAAHSRLEQVGQ
jgi:hypothetical protein